VATGTGLSVTAGAWCRRRRRTADTRPIVGGQWWRPSLTAAWAIRLRTAPQFLFICGHHRKSHHIDPRCVLAIVELPSQELAELRKRDEVKAAEWSAKCRAEDEERERAERRVSP